MLIGKILKDSDSLFGSPYDKQCWRVFAKLQSALYSKLNYFFYTLSLILVGKSRVLRYFFTSSLGLKMPVSAGKSSPPARTDNLNRYSSTTFPY
jgi:hypothetical protein